MKLITYILFFILLSGCASKRNYYVLVEHLNARQNGDLFIDSLKNAEVDTIVGFYYGCSGCNSGSEVYYVNWIDNEVSFIKKFTNYSNYDHIQREPMALSYISSILDTLQSEKLKEAEIYWSHYRYESVRIILNYRDVSYQIAFFEKAGNETSHLVLLINNIRLYLEPLHDYEWQGSNYKTEKVKRKNIVKD